MLAQKVIEKQEKREDLLLEEDWVMTEKDADDSFYLPRHTPNDYNPFMNPEFNSTVWWI